MNGLFWAYAVKYRDTGIILAKYVDHAVTIKMLLVLCQPSCWDRNVSTASIGGGWISTLFGSATLLGKYAVTNGTIWLAKSTAGCRS